MTLEEFRLNIESEQLTVNTNGRIYNATWSYEAVQDLNAQHNIDAVAALHDMLIAEINAEIDREILNDLNSLSTRRELPYLSQEAVDDIMAWTGNHDNFSDERLQRKFQRVPIGKINWKTEGF